MSLETISSLARRSGGGFSMLELLIAITIISLSCLPILYMASYNMETTRLDRVRAEAEAICHNALERWAQDTGILTTLPTSPSDPKLHVGDDIYADLSKLYSTDLGHLGIANLVSQYKFRMRVEFKQDVAEKLDRLICRVYWVSDRERSTRKKDETVAYARYILREHH